MNLVEFTKQAFTQGGGSLRIHSGTINPTQGYMVATENNEVKIQLNQRLKEELKIYELTKQVFLYMADKLEVWHNTFDIYLGLWFNEKDGLWYLDLSEHYYQFENAVKAGLERKQLAIWDCNVGKSIDLDASKKFQVSVQIVESSKTDPNDASKKYVTLKQEIFNPVYAQTGDAAINFVKLLQRDKVVWSASAIEIN